MYGMGFGLVLIALLIATAGYIHVAQPAPGTLKWRFQTTSGAVLSSPAIDCDGTIYVGSAAGDLYAFHPDGALKWQRSLAGGIADNSPAISANGTIYVSTTIDLYAFHPDGTLQWTFLIISWSSPAIGTDGTIYVGSEFGVLYAINPDGTLKWRFKTGNAVTSSPAIGADGTIYFGSWDYYFYALYSNSLGPANSSWPMFHHDLQRTGRVSGSDRCSSPWPPGVRK